MQRGKEAERRKQLEQEKTDNKDEEWVAASSSEGGYVNN